MYFPFSIKKKINFDILILDKNIFYANGLSLLIKEYAAANGFHVRLISTGELLVSPVRTLIFFTTETQFQVNFYRKKVSSADFIKYFKIMDVDIYESCKKHNDKGVFNIPRDVKTESLHQILAKALHDIEVRGYKSLHPRTVFGSQWLSTRERDVLQHLTQGMNNKNIGEKLGINEKTVSIHKRNVMKKMKLKTNKELCFWLTQKYQ